MKWKEISSFISKVHGGEQAAYGEEIHLFLHCHLRGYDKNGTGKQMDASYYDKYGAPVTMEDTWTHGHYIVERTLADHFKMCTNPEVKNPLVAGYGGGCHLYKEIHDADENSKPWDWTGWVPLQDRWISQGPRKMFFHKNRYFMTLRGNEVQNNLWDYHPHDEEETSSTTDWIYDQISPNDKYRGGYFYKGNPRARYLHIMSLRTHHEAPELVKRYNYIVHPLAYRADVNTLPDASVDGIQWSVMEISRESHFTSDEKKWGERCHAIELFNDFTLFYSYQPAGDYTINNGELMYIDGSKKIVWFDTYPLEFCEFLIENALARGTYLQILSANDAFYNRDVMPPNPENLSSRQKSNREACHNILLSDPKGKLVKQKAPDTSLFHVFKRIRDKRRAEKNKTEQTQKAMDFFKTRPYTVDSVFGYTTLIDTKGDIRNAVFPNQKALAEDLEAGEELMMDFLIRGRFFSHTGIYDIFRYPCDKSITIPISIAGQLDENELCFTLDPATMDMKFYFPCVNDSSLIWRYSIEQKDWYGRETVNGYFKLSKERPTVLDLTSNYDKENLKWIRFTAFDPENPMKRAWFNPITGPAFIENPCIDLPTLKHRIAKTTCSQEISFALYVEDGERFSPTECSNQNRLQFDLPAVGSENNENLLYAYFASGNSLQAEINQDTQCAGVVPERILQNIQGYIPLSAFHGTRLDMSRCWDSKTIKKVFFYGIDVNAQPFNITVTNAIINKDAAS